MRKEIQQLVQEALAAARAAGRLPVTADVPVEVERARDAQHGDYATNLAMRLAKPAQRKPREVAEVLVEHIPANDLVADVVIAGPGFINFTLRQEVLRGVVTAILEAGERYGRTDTGAGERVLIEFVSANPTGPLHVGHGRGAAYGSVLADLLEAAGYRVEREYYVNDGGRQMNILAVSLWIRYLQACGETVTLPEAGYRGEYVRQLAETLHGNHGEDLRRAAAEVTEGLPADAPDGDKEQYVDALFRRMQSLLGPGAETVFQVGLEGMLADIRDDLAAFGVRYDRWFSERSLSAAGLVDKALARLETAGYLYRDGGALWFRASAFGDEKDRVVIRENGEATYFANDIAYHLDKLDRGYDHLIDVWGADHHGYVARVKAALEALAGDPGRLEIMLVQFAILYRGGERLSMSTRSGEFVTLRELREEVGTDAARFFYVSRRPEQHLDFDLDLAKSQSQDNPVYYLQYAHARIASVFRQAAERGYAVGPAEGLGDLESLAEAEEMALLRVLIRFPEVVDAAAAAREPHQVSNYLREVAVAFHAYYNAQTFLVADASLRRARLALVGATQQVVANGLGLLGVSAPEAM